MPVTKIATCCYCGTRAALRLRGAERHELSCASCGAPLRNMKEMPVARAAGQSTGKPARNPAKPVAAPSAKRSRPDRTETRNPKKRRNRKGLWRKIAEEVWDEIEDIFD
ncbi:hypothetical protein [Thalassorhabdomicrobium marinisediminis]|uniref:hypothetical protein n=1 Tax=Thalassorhabdomicrobium marinisediminis TaxID=2170577 RepID=UPI00249016C1|nr:hypothetical protein [Thalassorhabdomicrobium marinisediminis]